jgi:hypothetical protein
MASAIIDSLDRMNFTLPGCGTPWPNFVQRDVEFRCIPVEACKGAGENESVGRI